MVELCILKNSVFFCSTILTVLGGKMMSQDCEQNSNFKIWQNKIIILKKAQQDRIECEKIFRRA